MPETAATLKEYRCSCNWLLFKAELIGVVTIEVRCTRSGCKTMNTISVETLVLDKSKIDALV